MKLVSKVALAATLVVGLDTAGLVAPAFAAKDQPAAAPTISGDVRAGVASAQAALAATPKNLSTAESGVAAVEAAARSDYERYLAQSLRLSLENAKTQGQGDAQRGATLIPLEDALIANAATPPAEAAQRYNERGNLLYATKKFSDAAQSFARARDGGYSDADLPYNLARARIAAGDVPGGIGELDAAVKADQAAGRKVDEDVYKYAIAKLYAINASEQVEDWTRRWLTDYNNAANWRAAVYAFGLTGPSAPKYSKNRLDLYRLLYATKSLAGQKEYTDYADVALNVAALPEEARTVLKDGFTSGAIAPASPTGTGLQRQATTKLAAAPTPEAREKRARAGKDANLAQQAGDSYLATRNFAKAAEMYGLAEDRNYQDMDRNNLHLGIALAQAGDRDGAKIALGKVAGEPNRAIARLWLTFVLVPAPAAA